MRFSIERLSFAIRLTELVRLANLRRLCPNTRLDRVYAKFMLPLPRRPTNCYLVFYPYDSLPYFIARPLYVVYCLVAIECRVPDVRYRRWTELKCLVTIYAIIIRDSTLPPYRTTLEQVLAHIG